MVDSHGDTFRAVYTVQRKDAVYVLHDAFMKKARKDRATPKKEMDTSAPEAKGGCGTLPTQFREEIQEEPKCQYVRAITSESSKALGISSLISAWTSLQKKRSK
ncbi:type II toxin-antitoxin system RelE/ParE family toxin [Rhizobium sp. YTU87027]|uniref:type II toxin-antitoxin system RelE/ParE family toxin n=1 Tax=Rhizobium sp. YTU87027 TaxID=3417741 RepID=UPI003D689EC2